MEQGKNTKQIRNTYMQVIAMYEQTEGYKTAIGIKQDELIQKLADLCKELEKSQVFKECLTINNVGVWHALIIAEKLGTEDLMILLQAERSKPLLCKITMALIEAGKLKDDELLNVCLAITFDLALWKLASKELSIGSGYYGPTSEKMVNAVPLDTSEGITFLKEIFQFNHKEKFVELVATQHKNKIAMNKGVDVAYNLDMLLIAPDMSIDIPEEKLYHLCQRYKVSDISYDKVVALYKALLKKCTSGMYATVLHHAEYDSLLDKQTIQRLAEFVVTECNRLTISDYETMPWRKKEFIIAFLRSKEHTHQNVIDICRSQQDMEVLEEGLQIFATNIKEQLESNYHFFHHVVATELITFGKNANNPTFWEKIVPHLVSVINHIAWSNYREDEFQELTGFCKKHNEFYVWRAAAMTGSLKPAEILIAVYEAQQVQEPA